MNMCKRIWIAVAACIISLNASAAVVKGVPECGMSCTWSMSVDGNMMASGMYTADPDTGDIQISQPWMIDLADGGFIRLMNMNGNIDPILGFSVAAGTTGTGRSFSFSFSLPVALSGPIDASSSLSYSLTSLSADGAQVSPLFGSNVLIARDVDTSPGGIGSLNKGVDIGSTFFFTGGPKTESSPVYTATNSFAGDLAYDLMSVTLAFSLSPESQVGMSGFVQQTVVPVPAAIWLLGSGVAMIGCIGRRRSRIAQTN